MKPLVLSIAVGGLCGLLLGERDVPSTPDPWLAEALRALVGDARAADIDRALYAVNRRLVESPDDLAALTLKHRLEHQRECRRSFDAGEHAFVTGQRGLAISAFRSVDEACALRSFAAARLHALTGEDSRPLVPAD